LAWSAPDPLFALEANIIATGAALDQIAELVGCQGGQELSGLAAKAEDTGGLSVVPAFSGLGAPYWDRSALGVIVGLRRETSPAQLARAAFDAVAQQVCDAVEAVDAAGAPVKEIRADGGPSRNPALMQWQADLLGKPVAVGSEAEVSALGAARLAWTTLGVELPPVAPNVTYFPALDPDRRQSERDRWADAVCRSRGLAAKRRIRPETTEATP
jgi:glycerol kinase